MKTTAKTNKSYLKKTYKKKQYYLAHGGMWRGSSRRAPPSRPPPRPPPPPPRGEQKFKPPFNNDGKLITCIMMPEFGEGVYLKAILKLGLRLNGFIDEARLQRIYDIIEKSEIHFTFIADRPTARRNETEVPGPLFPHVSIDISEDPEHERIKYHYGFRRIDTTRTIKGPENWKDKSERGFGTWKAAKSYDDAPEEEQDNLNILLKVANVLMEAYSNKYFKELLQTQENIDIEQLDIGNLDAEVRVVTIGNVTETSKVKNLLKSRSNVITSPKIFKKIGIDIGLTQADATIIATADVASIQATVATYAKIIENIRALNTPEPMPDEDTTDTEDTPASPSVSRSRTPSPPSSRGPIDETRVFFIRDEKGKNIRRILTRTEVNSILGESGEEAWNNAEQRKDPSTGRIYTRISLPANIKWDSLDQFNSSHVVRLPPDTSDTSSSGGKKYRKFRKSRKYRKSRKSRKSRKYRKSKK